MKFKHLNYIYLPKFGSEQAVRVCISKQALKKQTKKNPQPNKIPPNN